MTSEPKEQVELTDDEKKAKIDSLSKNHILASMGVGLIPLPFIDFVALTGIQLDFINKLSKIYGVEFSKDRGKNIISSLIGGVVPLPLSTYVSSFLKIIPIVGQTVGVLSMPVIAGAATYALGKVFVQHFESGGTFLDFEPDKVKEYFAEQFKLGKLKADRLKKESEKKA